ncbi:MAG: DoxX family protein [Hyphomicrobiales bacterium]|nr:DoxX family protein [Hyphomicrobiales bacterium]MBV8439910.1 DoxX family protein [Hyphomicrobiales bacterium]
MPSRKLTATLSGLAPYGLSVLRIVTGLLFVEHGMQKVFDFPPSGHGAVPLFSLIGFAGSLELVGGFLILIGLFTRPAAFILAGEMAVAYWTVHAAKSFFPAVNSGDAAILFCFLFLYFVVAGGGAWSLGVVLKSDFERHRPTAHA